MSLVGSNLGCGLWSLLLGGHAQTQGHAAPCAYCIARDRMLPADCGFLLSQARKMIFGSPSSRYMATGMSEPKQIKNLALKRSIGTLESVPETYKVQCRAGSCN